jgi:GH25 family lysozyme M1 (1,4-beta-N-acetylmuramidase)
MPQYLIDISNNQGGGVDTDAINAAGVLLKASEGASYTDPFRAPWQARLEGRGVPTGTYHFHRGTASPAAQLVRWKNSGLERGKFRPVIDAEDEKRTLDPAAMARSVLQLCEQTEADQGVTPLIYTGGWWIGNYCQRDPALARYPLWLSAYPLGYQRAPSDAEAAAWLAAGKYCKPPAPWTETFMWQFTSIARVPGVPGNCDRNIISDENFAELFRQAPAPQPPQETDDMIVPFIIAKKNPTNDLEKGARYLSTDGLQTCSWITSTTEMNERVAIYTWLHGADPVHWGVPVGTEQAPYLMEVVPAVVGPVPHL